MHFAYNELAAAPSAVLRIVVLTFTGFFLRDHDLGLDIFPPSDTKFLSVPDGATG